MLQQLQQPCETSLPGMSDAGVCPPVYPATPAISGGRMHSSTAAHLSGRSPSLVAMERVMPKYASWASSDVNAARWQLARDEKNVVDEYSPLVQPPCTAPRSRCSRASTSRLLPTSAAAAGARDPSDGAYGCVATVSVSSSSTVTSLSARSAKDELRARLSHRPSSSSAMRHVGQVGKASFVMYTPSLLGICAQDFDVLQ